LPKHDGGKSQKPNQTCDADLSLHCELPSVKMRTELMSGCDLRGLRRPATGAFATLLFFHLLVACCAGRGPVSPASSQGRRHTRPGGAIPKMWAELSCTCARDP